MKKFTLLFVFLALINWSLSAQCIRTYPVFSVSSNNSGLPQVISSCVYTDNDNLTISNLIVGSEYMFTCDLGSTAKYITVTTIDNEIITYGFSPLTVSNVVNSTLKLHFSDNAMCTGVSACHIVTVKSILSCPLPVALEIENLATTSANFKWLPSGEEAVWDILILPSTSPAPTASVENFTTVTDLPEFFAENLTPSMSYKFYYRAACSETEKSPWNFSEKFTMLCESVNYFSENFDTATTMPSCWSKVGSQGSAYVQNSNSAATLPNNLYMSDDFNQDQKPVVAMPIVDNFNAGTHRIKFKLRGAYAASGSLEFGYLINPNDSQSFTSIATFEAISATQFTEFTFIPDELFQNGNFAFRATNSIVLDDVVWEPAPLCDDVTGLNVVNFNSNSASLSWVQIEGVSQQVVYSALQTANPDDLTVLYAEGNSINLSGLESSTTYKIWVRSDCSNGLYGAWIGPKIVTTNCNTVTTFSQNFDASTNFPSCWKKVGTGGDAYIQNLNAATSAPNLLNMSSYDESFAVVAMPPISNGSAGTHRLKFNARSAYAVGGVIQVGYITNLNNPSSFVVLDSFTTTSIASFETFIYIPQVNQVLSETLAFRHSATPSNAVYIDNVVWEPAPTCNDVTAIQTANVTNTTAVISWTGNTETNWQVAYSTSPQLDVNTATIVAVENNPTTTLTALNAATTYYIWVRSNCGNGDFGVWISSVSIVTLCDAVTEFSENFDASSNLPACWSKLGSGSASIQTATDPSLKSVSISAITLALPPLSNAGAGTHKLTFKARSSYTVGGVIEVGYLQDINVASSFVALDTFIPTSTTEFETFNAYLGTAPQTPYIAIRHTGIPYNAVNIDDVTWELLPTCEDVMNVTNNLITDTAATVSWTAQTATNWQIVLGTATDNNPTVLTAIDVANTTYTFTELDATTNYKYWIRTNCGNGEFGTWIGPKSFTTQCDPIANFPWVENFENTTTPAIPSCWTKENGDYTTSNSTYILGPKSGVKYLRNNSAAVNEYVWIPGFALQAGHSYDLSTQVRGDGFDNWTVAMAYNTTPKSQGATALGAVYQVPGNGNVSTPMQYQEMTRTFTPTVSGTYYFALVVNENAAGYPNGIAFDDVTLNDNGALSTPEFNTNAFQAYPNPVKDILNISYEQNISSVEVFNLLGQNLITKIS